MTCNLNALRDCAPRETQRATFDTESATPGPTPPQQDSLKAAAQRVLIRNTARNTPATGAENTRNRCATATMNAQQEATIRAWLTHIGESDPVIIGEVLEKCRSDQVALGYFLNRAAEASTPKRL